MKITYFFRNIKCGYSIQHVFDSIIPEMENANDVEIVHMPSPNSMPWDLLRNTIYTFRNRNKSGINHITGHIHDSILGLFGCKSIVTIHDLVFLDNVKNPIKRFYKWLFWLYIPVKMADKITCISKKTRDAILTHIKTNKLVVIHNPIDPIYKFIPKEINKDKPIILHIGTGWNKNLNNTIEALTEIPCHLRIIGPLSEEQIHLLNTKKINYSNAKDLDDKEIKLEYVNCDIVSFPSIYEGFGMPIIEGQKTGRPVLTSQIEPLLEVGGNAALYIDPNDVNSIKNGFIKIINDDVFRDRLINDGLGNVDRFDNRKIALQYVNLYKEVLNK